MKRCASLFRPRHIMELSQDYRVMVQVRIITGLLQPWYVDAASVIDQVKKTVTYPLPPIQLCRLRDA
jgi:hypothetical protein